QRLAEVAEQPHRRAHHAADARHDLGPEVVLERRRVCRQGAKHQAGERCESQLARRMLLGPAVRRHAALAAEPLAEGDAGEIAAEIVAPVVIDADDVARLPALVEDQQRAAMGAAVLESVQRAVVVARHHHGHRAQTGAAIAVRAGQLGFKAEETPGRSLEDARLLLLVEVGVGVKPIWHAREAFGRPVTRFNCDAHCSSLTLAALITLCQRSISSRMYAAVACGVPPIGSADSWASRWVISPRFRAPVASAWIFSALAWRRFCVGAVVNRR